MKLFKDENSRARKYKYHVESSATDKGLIKSLEFIVLPNSRGDAIDRFLKIHYDNQLKVGCK